jgi:hypothetical protein
MLIDPFRSISFVASYLHRPGHRLIVVIDHLFVGAFQQRLDCGRLVGLAGREVKVKRMAVLVTQQMNFCGKTTARAT